MVSEHRAVLLSQSSELAAELEPLAARLMAELDVRKALEHPEPNRAVELCLDDLWETAPNA
jgi:hypothetical protein